MEMGVFWPGFSSFSFEVSILGGKALEHIEQMWPAPLPFVFLERHLLVVTPAA